MFDGLGGAVPHDASAAIPRAESSPGRDESSPARERSSINRHQHHKHKHKRLEDESAGAESAAGAGQEAGAVHDESVASAVSAPHDESAAGVGQARSAERDAAEEASLEGPSAGVSAFAPSPADESSSSTAKGSETADHDQRHKGGGVKGIMRRMRGTSDQ